MLAFLVASAAGYFYVSRWGSEFWGLFVIFTLQFAIYAFLIRRLSRSSNLSLPLCVSIAVILRVILLFSEPILENDYFRYLWDGRVLAHGINPYQFAPNDPALDQLSTDYRDDIGWSQFRTIYPPVAQFIFAATHIAAPDSLIGLKLIFILFDLLTGILLIQWFRDRGIDPRWSILYLLNPLVLKEISNSAHLDSIAVFFCFLAIYLFSQRKKSAAAWLSLAAATATKLFPILLVPFFMKLDSKWRRHVGYYLVFLAAIYAPFLDAGWNIWGGTNAYAKYWIFNAGIFQFTTVSLNSTLNHIDIFTQNPILQSALKKDYPAKLVLSAVFLFACAWKLRGLRRIEELPSSCLWVLGLLLILSPVVDAWYVLWILPLACLLNSVPWLTFSYLVILSYSWFFSEELAPIFRLIEYAVFYTIFIWWTYRAKEQNKIPVAEPQGRS